MSINKNFIRTNFFLNTCNILRIFCVLYVKGFSRRFFAVKKKIIISVSVLAGIFILGIATGLILLSVSGIGISSGYCLKTDNGTCFLIRENTPIRLSSLSEEKRSELETGDKILVLHDGIAESYPAATSASFIIKTGDGSIDDIPENVKISLTELGWIGEENAVNLKEYGFSAEYIRTGCPSDDGIAFPSVTVINTEEELNNYKNDNLEKYGLNDAFTTECEKYNEDYFSEKTLILVYLSEGSGSTSHKVTKVSADDTEKLSVYIETDTPEVGTCDMAYHHIFISIEKSAVYEKEADLFVDGKNMAKKWKDVTLSGNFANFTVSLPEKWTYTENGYAASDNFGISICHEDAPESSITIEFLSVFGVCGTGLSATDITVGGYNATKGVYDSNPTWDYIHFSDAPGEYVIFNNADPSWWKEYGDEAEEILDTLIIADGIIFREEALSIAEKNAAGEYKRTYGEYDHNEGVWEFTFIKSETEYHAKISATGEVL